MVNMPALFDLEIDVYHMVYSVQFKFERSGVYWTEAIALLS